MIRFSASLVVMAVGLLVAGVVMSKLALVYIAIGVSGIALLALGVGVVLNWRELAGKPGKAVPEASAPEPAPIAQAPAKQAAPWETVPAVAGTTVRSAQAGVAAAPWEADIASPSPFTARPEPQAPSVWEWRAEPFPARSFGQPPRQAPAQGAPAETAMTEAFPPPAPFMPALPADEPVRSYDRGAATLTPAVVGEPPPSGDQPSAEGEPREMGPSLFEPVAGQATPRPSAGAPGPESASLPSSTQATPAPAAEARPPAPAAEARPPALAAEAGAAPAAEAAATPVAQSAGALARSPVNGPGRPGEEPDGPGEPVRPGKPAGSGEPSASSEPERPGKPEEPTPSGPDLSLEVTVVPGVPRYHNAHCILIRFMGESDLDKMALAAAREAGCTPCRACFPDQSEESPG